MLDDLNDSDSLKQFQFEIVDGRVIAFFEIENGIVEQESIESQDSFEIDGNSITHTETKSDGGIETTVYVDEDGDGLYTRVSRTDEPGVPGNGSDDDSSGSGNRKSFEFEITNGVVTRVYEVDDGELELESIDANETYTLDGNDVIRTEIEAYGTEIYRYSDSDGDGRYQRVSEQWIPNSDGANGPRPVIEHLRYFSTDDDDFIAVRNDDSVKGGLGADSFVFKIESDGPNQWRIEDFHADEDDRLVFDTGLGLASKEQLAGFVNDLSYDGQDFLIVFAPEISITLVGVSPESISWDHVEVLS